MTTAFRRCRLAVGVVALLALGLPAGASAHGSKTVNALDFEARITSVATGTGGVSATVVDGDRKLALAVRGQRTVVVLGYAGEPFLRFSTKGVEVNERSPTAVIVKLAKRGSNPVLAAGAAPTWSQVSAGHRYAWHDDRLGPKPGLTYGEGNVAGWTIPLAVDGAPTRIAGRLWHAKGPGIWVWLALLAAAAVAAVALARKRNSRAVGITAVAGAVVACASALLVSIALGFTPGKPASAAWANTAYSVLVATAGLAALAFASRARQGVAGVVALFSTLAALSHANVLVRGYVIALVPAWIVRTAVATCVCAGVIAVAAGLVFFFGVDSGLATRRRPARSVRRAMAVPRGKARPR